MLFDRQMSLTWHTWMMFLSWGQLMLLYQHQNDLRSSFSPIGLEIQDKKCELLSPTASASSDVTFPVLNEVIIVPGTPVGNSSFISRVCTDFEQSGSLLCEELLQLGIHRVPCYFFATAMLTVCVICSQTFLLMSYGLLQLSMTHKRKLPLPNR